MRLNYDGGGFAKMSTYLARAFFRAPAALFVRGGPGVRGGSPMDSPDDDGTNEFDNPEGLRRDAGGVDRGGPLLSPIDDCARGGGVALVGGGGILDGGAPPIRLGEAVCALDGGGGGAGVDAAEVPSYNRGQVSTSLIIIQGNSRHTLPLTQRLSSLS